MIPRPLSATLLTIGTLLACLPPLGARELEFLPRVEAAAKKLVDDGHVIGVAVALVMGEKVESIDHGETLKGSGKRPGPDTVYEIGSVTKVFTGILLADAVHRGRMALDDPLQKYLPRGVTAPSKDGVEITLAHLASHTSGLPRLPDNISPGDVANPYADYSVRMLHDFLSKHELRRAPGVEYEYSNYAMGLLGHVISLREKRDYEKLVVGRIAKPLGMKDTRIALRSDMRRRLALPYNAKLERVKNWDLPTLAGAGALRSTCRDMVAFVRANVREESESAASSGRARRADAELGAAFRLAREVRHQKENGEAVGLGWLVARGGKAYVHSGMTGGYASYVAIMPERELGVVILANTASDRVSATGQTILVLAATEAAGAAGAAGAAR